MSRTAPILTIIKRPSGDYSVRHPDGPIGTFRRWGTARRFRDEILPLTDWSRPWIDLQRDKDLLQRASKALHFHLATDRPRAR